MDQNKDLETVKSLFQREISVLARFKESKPENVKDAIREIHKQNRIDKFERNRSLLEKHWGLLENALIDGDSLDVSRVDPYIVPVAAGTDDSALFRLATLMWSVPVSDGYGRRMRFLVRDRGNSDALIGIFALGDPVYNLGARDSWVGWSVEEKKAGLKSVLDAFVIGAMPPYSQIIGGKLVAALLASEPVQREFQRRYKLPLALVTTSSSLGRSSIYNRIKTPFGLQFHHIGYTKGFGHFHISDELFSKFKAILLSEGNELAQAYKSGDGPNWRFRVIREMAKRFDLDSDATHHGINREVFAIPLSDNHREILLGAPHQTVESWPVEVISEYFIGRWLLPRSLRDDKFKSFSVSETMASLSQTFKG